METKKRKRKYTKGRNLAETKKEISKIFFSLTKNHLNFAVVLSAHIKRMLWWYWNEKKKNYSFFFFLLTNFSWLKKKKINSATTINYGLLTVTVGNPKISIKLATERCTEKHLIIEFRRPTNPIRHPTRRTQRQQQQKWDVFEQLK